MSKKEKNEEKEIRIVILQRGWVAVGYFSRHEADCKIENAFVIRRWGTKKGLGELINGPLENTVIDFYGEMEFDWLTVISTIKCNLDGWKHKLAIKE